MKSIYPILICLLIIILLECAREYSCEGCKEKRTIPNELIISCNIYIDDESEVRKIYTEVKTKMWPGHYHIFDSLIMDGRHQYDSTFDLKNYLTMSDYTIGDTFFTRNEIRWKTKPLEFVGDTLLVY